MRRADGLYPGRYAEYATEIYRSERPNSASIGTRAYQMGLFIIFESGIQMMADNPTLYYRNDESTLHHPSATNLG